MSSFLLFFYLRALHSNPQIIPLLALPVETLLQLPLVPPMRYGSFQTPLPYLLGWRYLWWEQEVLILHQRYQNLLECTALFYNTRRLWTSRCLCSAWACGRAAWSTSNRNKQSPCSWSTRRGCRSSSCWESCKSWCGPLVTLPCCRSICEWSDPSLGRFRLHSASISFYLRHLLLRKTPARTSCLCSKLAGYSSFWKFHFKASQLWVGLRSFWTRLSSAS